MVFQSDKKTIKVTQVKEAIDSSKSGASKFDKSDTKLKTSGEDFNISLKQRNAIRWESYEVEFTIRRGSLRISRSISLATPCEIALIRSFLMLHVFLAPSPEAVEDVLLVKLHGSHHSIRHALGSHIIVLSIS